MTDPKFWRIYREARRGKPSILLLDRNGDELASINPNHPDCEHLVHLILFPESQTDHLTKAKTDRIY